MHKKLIDELGSFHMMIIRHQFTSLGIMASKMGPKFTTDEIRKIPLIEDEIKKYKKITDDDINFIIYNLSRKFALDMISVAGWKKAVAGCPEDQLCNLKRFKAKVGTYYDTYSFEPPQMTAKEKMQQLKLINMARRKRRS